MPRPRVPPLEEAAATRPVEDRQSPMSPQLALRAALAGMLALAMFGIIFFRLWFLQVLSTTKYVQAANTNQVRRLPIAPPRGEILDLNGNVLVGSTQALEVQISPPDLPTSPRARDVMYRRLAHVLGIPTRRVRCRVAGQPNPVRLAPIACDVAQQLAVLPYAFVDVKELPPSTGRYVQYYLAERQLEFPGVQVGQISIPSYPQGELAAQVLGTVGRITGQQCWGHDLRPGEAQPAPTCTAKGFRGEDPSAIVGQMGLEAQYDQYLRGAYGYQQVQVNALGQPTADLGVVNPVRGHNLRLSLDLGLERVGMQALETSIASNPGADAGSFVAMNPENGEIYAMGSYPSYDPSIFTRPISQGTWNSLTSPSTGQPLLNRATQSAGPTGSTFKPITATAALESGVWGINDTYTDTGQFCFPGTTLCLHNAGHAANGTLNLISAIQVSDDVFFYHLGYLTNGSGTGGGGPLDHWAHLFGIGRFTGVDLPAGSAGNLPTPRWRAHMDALELRCEKRHHVPPADYFQPGHTCGIADGRPWSVGDNVNLAVGQGDVQVTPLQLAVVYAALANGGTIVRPHLGLDVQNEAGTVLQKIDPPPARHISIDPAYLDAIRTGLRDAVLAGTSADTMGSFPEQVYGKTGTAQYTNQPDYAWYACFVPSWATSKPIVVVVHVERGGFGDVAAAPVARQILSQWFFGKPGAYHSGSSRTL